MEPTPFQTPDNILETVEIEGVHYVDSPTEIPGRLLESSAVLIPKTQTEMESTVTKPEPVKSESTPEPSPVEIADKKEVIRKKIRNVLDGMTGDDEIFNKFFEGNDRTLDDLTPEERTEMGRLLLVSVGITENLTPQDCINIFEEISSQVKTGVARELSPKDPNDLSGDKIPFPNAPEPEPEPKTSADERNEPTSAPVEPTPKTLEETFGITYDLSKLSKQTKERIIYELQNISEFTPDDDSGREAKKELMDQLTHNPLVYFEFELKDLQVTLEILNRDGTLDEVRDARENIAACEKIIADLQKNIKIETKSTPESAPIPLPVTEPGPKLEPIPIPTQDLSVSKPKIEPEPAPEPTPQEPVTPPKFEPRPPRPPEPSLSFERPEPAPAPAPTPMAETLPNKEAIEKAERIRILREKIEANTKAIAELRKMLSAMPDESAAPAPVVDELDAQLSLLNEQLRKTSKVRILKRAGLEDRIKELEKQIRERNTKREQIAARIVAQEKDKVKNPFKYYLLNKLNPKNLQVMFMADRNNISVEQINRITGEDGQNCKFFETNLITQRRDNAIKFSSNGFYLKLKNREEIVGEENGKRVLMIYGDEARYDIVAPDGAIVGTDLNYQTGDDLYYKKAEEYQKQQLAEFEAQVKK
jgi:hypothetical protein